MQKKDLVIQIRSYDICCQSKDFQPTWWPQIEDEDADFVDDFF